MKTERRTPAALVAAVFEIEPPTGPVLYAGEDAADARQRAGHDGDVWLRETGGVEPPSLWPQTQEYAAASLRLPRAHDAYIMALHAIAARLKPGAPLYVYGPNDEGIKSSPRDFTPFFDNHESLLTRGHARIWKALRTPSNEGLRPTLGDWKRVQPLAIGEIKRDWVSYPGVFAQGLLDPATALLIDHLPQSGPGAALDFGAGTGILARLLAERGFAVTMVERDMIALEAARENVPQGEAILGDRLTGAQKFDLIVSNPPIHLGKALDLSVLEHLIAEAPKHLRRGGAMLIVTQQTVPVPRLAEGRFAKLDQLAENQGFRVWRLSAS